jgi:hypothetical protein
MKHDTFDKYLAGAMDLPERALLTVWDCLPDYHDDLVLVGGLAIRHLTDAPVDGAPGPMTLDVDFGIDTGAGGQYGSIRQTLGMHDFRWNGQRFVRPFENMTLFVDLLTDDGGSGSSSAMVDDSLPVSVFPGIDSALRNHRWVQVSGRTLVGAETTVQVKVADVGPLLVLKLNAFGGPKGRKAPKDVHDILYLAMHYKYGTEDVIKKFKEERATENRGMIHAIHALETCFKNHDDTGPLSCAAFRLNNRHLEPEFEDESLQIRQQCVTLAQELLS